VTCQCGGAHAPPLLVWRVWEPPVAGHPAMHPALTLIYKGCSLAVEGGKDCSRLREERLD